MPSAGALCNALEVLDDAHGRHEAGIKSDHVLQCSAGGEWNLNNKQSNMKPAIPALPGRSVTCTFRHNLLPAGMRASDS